MIKEKFIYWQTFSGKIGVFFAKNLPFPPHFYTLMSGIVALLAVIVVHAHQEKCAILLFMLAAWCDIIDGAVARARDIASHLGAYLDGVMDRFVDFALIYAYFFCNISPPWLDLSHWICLAVFVVILPSFNVAYANHRKAVKDDHETLIWRMMNRGEMYVLMLSILIAAQFNPIIAGYLLVLLVFLSTITILQTIIMTIYYAKKD